MSEEEPKLRVNKAEIEKLVKKVPESKIKKMFPGKDELDDDLLVP